MHEPRIASVASRYPEFARVPDEIGLHRVVGNPVHDAAQPIGALCLYGSGDGSFASRSLDHAIQIADLIGFIVASTGEHQKAVAFGRQITEAMRSRAVIEQAKGVIMASTGVDPDAAFDLLRQQSQAENRKVRDLAADLVRRQHACD